MNYISIEFTLSQKSIDIYLSGCSGVPKCSGCHNPESWDFNIGNPISGIFLKIESMLQTGGNLIENIMIFGGEPLDQDHSELEVFLKNLKQYQKKIWLFTRYEIEEVPDFIKTSVDFIKTGRYISELTCDDNIQFGIKLSTSNQKIHEVILR